MEKEANLPTLFGEGSKYLALNFPCLYIFENICYLLSLCACVAYSVKLT